MASSPLHISATLPQDSDTRLDRTWILLLGALLVAACVSRAVGLGDWTWSDGELETLRDSLRLKFTSPKPLLFFLNHYLVLPVAGVSELSLRILPYLAGVASVPLTAEIGRRLFGKTAGVAAGLAVLVSPWHLHHSQWARYYTFLFLLSPLILYWIYRGITSGRLRFFLWGGAAFVVAFLFHPSAVFLLPGLGLWSASVLWKRFHRFRFLGRRETGWVALGVLILGLLIGPRFAAIAYDWVQVERWGYSWMRFVLATVSEFTVPFTVAAAAGAVALALNDRIEWERRLLLPLVLAGSSLAAAPVPLLAAVRPQYVFVLTPIAVLAVGAFAGSLVTELKAGGERGRALAWGAIAIILTAPLPDVVSHYVDGGRPDLRVVAVEMARRSAAEPAPTFVDALKAMQYYDGHIDGKEFEPTLAMLDEIGNAVRDSGAWVGVSVRRKGIVEDNRRGGNAEPWLHRHCHRVWRHEKNRYDYQIFAYDIFWCPKSSDLEMIVEPSGPVSTPD